MVKSKNDLYLLEKDLEDLYDDLQHAKFDKITFRCLDNIKLAEYIPEKIIHSGMILNILKCILDSNISYFDDLYDNISNNILYNNSLDDSYKLFALVKNDYLLDKKKFYSEIIEKVNRSNTQLELLSEQDIISDIEMLYKNALELEIYNQNNILANIYSSDVIYEITELYNDFIDDIETKNKPLLNYLKQISYVLKFKQSNVTNSNLNKIFREYLSTEKVNIIKRKINEIIETLKVKYYIVESQIFELSNYKEIVINYNRKFNQIYNTDESLFILRKQKELNVQYEEPKKEEKILLIGGKTIISDSKINSSQDFNLLTTIIYPALRVADTIHDFNGKLSNLQNYFNEILFYISNIVKPKLSEFSKGFTISSLYDILVEKNAKIFDIPLLQDNCQGDYNICLDKLDVTKHVSGVEDYIMNEIANVIKKIYVQTTDNGQNILRKTYRPVKDDLEIVINQMLISNNKKCIYSYIDKNKIIKNDKYIDSSNTNPNNLLLLGVDKKESKIDKETYDNLKKFFEGRQLGISYDMGPIVLKILELVNDYEKTNYIQNKDKLFFVPEKIIAEVWDPADNKNATKTRYDNITNQIIYVENDLLDIDNEKDGRLVTICNPEQSLTLSYEAPDKVIGVLNKKINGNVKRNELNKNEKGEYEHKYGEIGKVVKRISNQNFDPCDGFYVKNSGDWGQVKSAKNNKMIILTEDRLCNEYAVLTDTSSIYAFNMKKFDNYYFFLLHKGELKKDFIDTMKDIKSLLYQQPYVTSFEITIKQKDNTEKSFNLLNNVNFDIYDKESKILNIKINEKVINFEEENISTLEKQFETVKTEFNLIKQQKDELSKNSWNQKSNEWNNLITKLDWNDIKLKFDKFNEIFLDKILVKLANVSINLDNLFDKNKPGNIVGILKDTIDSYFNLNKYSFLSYLIINDIGSKPSFYLEYIEKNNEQLELNYKIPLLITGNHFNLVSLIKNKISIDEFKRRLPFVLCILYNILLEINNNLNNQELLKKYYNLDLSDITFDEILEFSDSIISIKNLNLDNDTYKALYSSLRNNDFSILVTKINSNKVIRFLKLSFIILDNFLSNHSQLFSVYYPGIDDVSDFSLLQIGNRYDVCKPSDLTFEFFLNYCESVEDVQVLLKNLIKITYDVITNDNIKQNLSYKKRYLDYMVTLVYIYNYLLKPNELCISNIKKYIISIYNSFSFNFGSYTFIGENVNKITIQLSQNYSVSGKKIKKEVALLIENINEINEETENEEQKILFEYEPVFRHFIINLPKFLSSNSSLNMFINNSDLREFINRIKPNENDINELKDFTNEKYIFSKSKLDNLLKEKIKTPISIINSEKYEYRLSREKKNYVYNLDVPNTNTIYKSIDILSDFWELTNNPIVFLLDPKSKIRETYIVPSVKPAKKISSNILKEYDLFRKELTNYNTKLFSGSQQNILNQSQNYSQDFSITDKIDILENISFLIQNNLNMINVKYREPLSIFVNNIEHLLELYTYNKEQTKNDTNYSKELLESYKSELLNYHIYNLIVQKIDRISGNFDSFINTLKTLFRQEINIPELSIPVSNDYNLLINLNDKLNKL